MKRYVLCLTALIFSLTVLAQNNEQQLEKIKSLLHKASAVPSRDTTNTKIYLNEAEKLAIAIKSDTSLCRIYNNYGIMYAKLGAANNSLAYFEKQLSAAKRSGNQKFVTIALRNTANIISDMGDNKKAIERYQQAYQIAKNSNDPKEQSANLVNMGMVYMTQGNYNTSMQTLLLALDINEKTKNLPEVAYVQYVLAALYNRMKNFDKALELNFQALESFKKLKDEHTVAAIRFNIATIQIKRKQFAEAKENLLDNIPYFEKINSKDRLMKTYGQLLVIAERTLDEKQAEKYLKLSLQYSALNGNVINDITVLRNQSGLDILEEKFAAAEQKLDKALEMATKANQFLELLNVRRDRIVLYQQSGQARKATLELAEYDLAKEKVLNEENLTIVNQLKTSYETEKKEKQIDLLNKDNRIKSLDLLNRQLQLDKSNAFIKQQDQQLKISQLELTNKNQLLANQQLDAEKKTQNIKSLQKQSRIQKLELQNKNLEVKQRNLAIGSLLMAFIAVGAISFSYYKRNKLKQQNLLQAEIYKQQEIATRAVFEGEQNERIRIARDLHDGIGQMLSVVKMNVSTLNSADKTVDNTLNLVDKTIDELRSISHNLIPEALNFGLYAALEDICQKINDTGKTQVNIHVAENVQHINLAQQNKLSVYRIVQEVLNNMVKHANASQIDVDITKGEAHMLIAIRDNGVGFDTAKIDDSKGIGWKNISARVHLLDGDMNIKSEKLLGTQIEISIPA